MGVSENSLTHQELNLGPSVCWSGALPTELWNQMGKNTDVIIYKSSVTTFSNLQLERQICCCLGR